MNEISEKHIALFQPSLRGGGAERVMVNLASGFVERGLKVDMVLVKAEGPYLEEVHKDVHIVDLRAKRVLYSLPRLVRYLRQERPDAMLSTLNHANIIALWARWIAGAQLRMVVREANTASISAAKALIMREKILLILMRIFYPFADEVIANSYGVARDLIKCLRLPEENVNVIYNPSVTPDIFTKAKEPLVHPWFAPGQPPVVIGIGRLTRQKDFPTLIKAFSLVRGQVTGRLMILGKGEERPELESLVRELGLEEDVEFVGFVENPYKYLMRSSVFVLSSRWEGLPNVLIQALALGIRVISTNCPSGPAEILEDGKWGDLVPVGDHTALAETILANLAGKSNNLNASKAREYAVSRFGLDRVISEYSQALLGDA